MITWFARQRMGPHGRSLGLRGHVAASRTIAPPFGAGGTGMDPIWRCDVHRFECKMAGWLVLVSQRVVIRHVSTPSS